MRESSHTRWQKVVVVCFFLLLCLPSSLMMVLQDRGDLLLFAENRSLNTLPPAPSSVHEWIALPRGVEAYYRDHFGLRSQLLTLTTNLRHSLGGAIDGNYFTGKDHWVFLGNSGAVGSNFLDQLRGAAPLDEDTLSTFVKRINKIDARLAAQGVDLMVSFAPEKHSIYPDYLPSRIRQVGPSRLDQLSNALYASDFFVDASKVLEIERQRFPDRPLYFVLDSHWNCWGAYLVYRAILEKGIDRRGWSAPVVQTGEIAFRQINEFNARPRSLRYWLQTLQAKDSAFECLLERNSAIRMHLLFGSEIFELINGERFLPETEYPERPVRYEAWHAINETGQARLRALVVRDSYGSFMVPYLNRSFSEVIYLHRDYLKLGGLAETISAFDPDVLLLLYAERTLSDPLVALHRLNMSLSVSKLPAVSALHVPSDLEKPVPMRPDSG